MSNLIEPQAEDERLLEAKVEDLYQHVRAITPRIPRKKLSATLSLPSHNDFEFDLHDDKIALTNQPSVVLTPTSSVYSPPKQYLTPDPVSPSSPESSLCLKQNNTKPKNWVVDAAKEDPELSYSDEKKRKDTELEEVNYDLEDEAHQNYKQVDLSLYTTKKNVAQGLLDISLLSANCFQLKYLLFHYERDSSVLGANSSEASNSTGPFNWLLTSYDVYFLTNLVCIGLSIFLQVVVGILLILNGRHNIYVHRYQRVADSYSNLILITVFIITIVNIFLSVFISAR